FDSAQLAQFVLYFQVAEIFQHHASTQQEIALAIATGDEELWIRHVLFQNGKGNQDRRPNGDAGNQCNDKKSTHRSRSLNLSNAPLNAVLSESVGASGGASATPAPRRLR